VAAPVRRTACADRHRAGDLDPQPVPGVAQGAAVDMEVGGGPANPDPGGQLGRRAGGPGLPTTLGRC
jgi:hypothetical protein